MTRGLAPPILRREAVAAARAIDLGPADVEALDRGEIPVSVALLVLLADATDGPARAGHLIREVGLMGIESLAPLALGATTIPQRIRAWEAAIGEVDYVALTKLLRVLKRRSTKADRKAEKRAAAGKAKMRAFADAIEEATGGLVSGDELVESFSGPLTATAKRAAARGLGPREWASRVWDLCAPAIESGRATTRLVISSLIREAVAGRNGMVSAWDLAEAISAAVNSSNRITPTRVIAGCFIPRLMAAAATIPAGRIDEYIDCVIGEHGRAAQRSFHCYISKRTALVWRELSEVHK